MSHIWEQFVPYIRLGKLTGEDLKTLEDGLALIEQTEAYQNYCIPLEIPLKTSSEMIFPYFGNLVPGYLPIRNALTGPAANLKNSRLSSGTSSSVKE